MLAPSILLIWSALIVLLVIAPPPPPSISSQTKMATRTIQCSEVQLDNCLVHIHQVANDSRLAFPVTRTELNQTCRLLEDGDRCTAQFINHCLESRVNSMLQSIIQGAKNVLQLLCNNATIQNNYLLHSGCFRDIALGTCASQFQRFRAFSEQSSQHQELSTALGGGQQQSYQADEVWLQRFCCTYKASIECQVKAIASQCSHRSAALAFYRHYTAKMADSLLTEHCLIYTYSDQCHHQFTPFKRFTNLDKNTHHRSVTSINPANSATFHFIFTFSPTFLVFSCLKPFI